ncbi:MAG: YgjP-like metallopeptidase domain-containing protein [Bacilli bacterium]
MKYEVDNVIYNVSVKRKNIKNLYIRFKNNIIHVNIPFFVSNDKVDKLLDDNIESLRSMIKRSVKQNEYLFLGEKIDIVSISNLKYPEYVNGKLFIKDRNKIDEAYKFLAEPIFKDRLDYIYKLFEEDIPYPTLKIRKMTSRWGVCNRRTKSVTLNLELIKWDCKYIDYVIVHELSHFVHFNHSASFWQTVNKYCKTYKDIRKDLRE